MVSGLALAVDRDTESKKILIGNYTLVSVTPVDGKNFDFAYRVDATNKGKSALSSLVLKLTFEAKKSFNAIDAELSFRPIAAGKPIIRNISLMWAMGD